MNTMDADWIRTDFKAVDKRDPVRSVQGWLTGDTHTRPIVLDGKRPFGIPNKRAFMSGRLHENEKLDHFTLPTPVLAADTSHYDAINAVNETLAPYLPVGDRTHALGYVTAYDLCSFLDEGPGAADAAVRLPVLAEADTMDRAMQLFRQEVVDHLPVSDANGRLSGVLERGAVLRIQHERLVGMGRVDFQSERNRLLNDPVQGFAETAWREVDATADYDEMLDGLRESDYAFVPDIVDPLTGRPMIGVVTPAYVARAAHRAHTEGWSLGSRAEGQLQQRNPFRIPDTPVRPKQMGRS